MAIWTRSPHQQFTVKVGGPPLENAQFAAPWEAYSVLLSNRTNQHLHLPDINWWVPPGVVGQVMPVPGLMQCTARFEAPPQVTDHFAVNGQIATLDFFAEEQAPYPGVSMPTDAPITQATSIGVIKNANDAVTIQCGGSGFLSVFLVGTLDGGNGIAMEATIDNLNWFGIPFFAYGAPAANPLTWVRNTIIQGLAPNAQLAFSVASCGFTQIRARLTGANGTGITITARAIPGAMLTMPMGQQLMNQSMPVTLPSDYLAGRPGGLLTARFSGTIAPSGTSTIVALSGATVITVYAVDWGAETLAAGVQDVYLEGTSSIAVSSIRINTQEPASRNLYLPFGIGVGSGQALQVHVGAGGPSVDASGVVYYTQQ